MKFSRFFGLVALAAMVVTPAMASTTTELLNRDGQYSIGKGDLETDFGLDVHILRGDASTEVINFSLGFNYFLTDILAPGMEFWMIDTGGTDVRILPNLKAYWPGLGRMLPYGIVGLGYENLGAFNLFDIAFGFGAKYLLSNTVAIGASFRYDVGVGGDVVHDIQFPIEFALFFKL